MPATGGVGSNQYQTKAGGSSGAARRETAATADAVTQPDDLEEIAWAFHPDRDNWEAAGVDREDVLDYSMRGMRAFEAGMWIANGATCAFEAQEWDISGVAAKDLRSWLGSGVINTDDYGDTCPRYPWDDASALRRAGFEPLTAARIVYGLQEPETDEQRSFVERWTPPSLAQAVPAWWGMSSHEGNRALTDRLREVAVEVESELIADGDELADRTVAIQDALAGEGHTEATGDWVRLHVDRWEDQVCARRGWPVTERPDPLDG